MGFLCFSRGLCFLTPLSVKSSYWSCGIPVFVRNRSPCYWWQPPPSPVETSALRNWNRSNRTRCVGEHGESHPCPTKKSMFLCWIVTGKYYIYIYMIINQWNPVDINYWWVYCCFLYILYVHCRLYGSILHDPNDVEYWEYAIWSSTNICTWLVIYIW